MKPAVAADPFTGVWKCNVAKSKFAWPAPKRLVTTIEADAEVLRVCEEEINAEGKALTVTVEARFDGREYPVAGSPHADAVAYTRADSRTITGRILKGGKLVLCETATVSEDGKTLTSQYSGNTEDGGSLNGYAVFEKQ
jgi:hypothetical protein